HRGSAGQGLSAFPSTSLAVFPSVARGKVSVPQAVTPSYTQEYLAGICSSLTLSCAPPAMSLLQCPRQCPLADAGIRLLGSVPCERRDVQRRSSGKFKNVKKV
ncbi:unnamed protein product, partial [Staurois parvus]